MPAVIATLSSAALLAVCAARWCSSARAGGVAALLFLTMPVTWSATAAPAPQLWLLPPLLTWLIALVQFDRTSHTRWLALAGAALSTMPYLHLMGVVMAPAYGIVTVTVLILRRQAPAALLVFLAGVVSVGLPWLAIATADPSWFPAAIANYGLYDAERFNILQGGREMASWVGLTVRSEVYWDCFDPAWLFLGEGGVTATLLGSKMFLLPLAIPLVMGLADFVRHPRQLSDWMVLGAFLVAPFAAALLAQPPVPGRLVLIAPVVALIATRPFVRRAAGSPPPARH